MSEKLTTDQMDKAKKAAQYLRDAAAKLPILRNVGWQPEMKMAFFASGAQNMPKPDYSPIDFGLPEQAIQAARKLIDGEHPVTEWLKRIADTLDITIALLQSRGTADFYNHSAQLYSTPERFLLDGQTRTLDMARHIDETLSDLELTHLVRDGADEALSASQFVKALRPKLKEHFGQSAPKVRLSENLSARVTAGSRRIRVRKDAQFTRMDVAQLLQHEAFVHAATALNGRAQTDFSILGYAHAGTTQIQEGLAVFAEMIAGTMDPQRFRRLADRVIAIQMSVDGADFIQIYRFFLERIDDPEQSYENARRVVRGGLVTGGAPFTKDIVYLNGLLRVHNFLRSSVKLNRADLIRLLFIGKLDLEDVPALAYLTASGQLQRPEFLPRWAADLRFVVSYLSYSGFLNRIKMPGFQGYYEERLKDVPSLWEAL